MRARRSVDFPYDVVYLVLSLVSSSVFSIPFSKSNRTKRTTVSYLATRTVGAERRRRDRTRPTDVGPSRLRGTATQRNRGSRFPFAAFTRDVDGRAFVRYITLARFHSGFDAARGESTNVCVSHRTRAATTSGGECTHTGHSATTVQDRKSLYKLAQYKIEDRSTCTVVSTSRTQAAPLDRTPCPLFSAPCVTLV